MFQENSYYLPFSTFPHCPSKLFLASWCTLKNRWGSKQIWGSLGLICMLAGAVRVRDGGLSGGSGLFRHPHERNIRQLGAIGSPYVVLLGCHQLNFKPYKSWGLKTWPSPWQQTQSSTPSNTCSVSGCDRTFLCDPKALVSLSLVWERKQLCITEKNSKDCSGT